MIIEHEQFRATVRRFVEREISPHVAAWDEAQGFPRGLFAQAAEIGLLGLGYPERLGGTPGDWWLRLICMEEIARAGSGGVMASLFSHNIALPILLTNATEELQNLVIPEVLTGQKIAALAMTEPSGGSDLANLRSSARRMDNPYVLNGEKCFITSGMRANWIIVAARTGGEGAGGISLFVVPGDTPGLTRTLMQKMGWWASDTATLHFDNCHIPASHLIGQENAGFRALMENFNGERLMLSAGAVSFAQVCYDEALAWARERRTFGATLVQHQLIRHQLMDMRMRIEASRAWLHSMVTRLEAQEVNPAWVADLCLLKNQATQSMQYCADAGVQILGGSGYMRGTHCERIYRECKVMMIGGGTQEIMKELAARQLSIG